MRIIIKDSKLNLKVKTDNIKLAELILSFFSQKEAASAASTAFRAGVVTSDLMNQLKNSIKVKESGEVIPPAPKTDMSKVKDKLLDNVKGTPKLKRKYRRKAAFISWTDEEILFLKNNIELPTKQLINQPELSRHTEAAILTKRYGINYKKANNLSKHHLELIK